MPAYPNQSRTLRADGSFDRRRFQTEMDNFKRERDLEYYSRWGFMPGQRKGVMAAQDAAEAEYRQAIEGLGSVRNEINGAPYQQLEEYYSGIMGGGGPYDEATTANLVRGATDPMIAGARGAASRMESTMAARGLGRSGATAHLRNQYMTGAITQAAGAGADIRSKAHLANFDARNAAAGSRAQLMQGRNQNLASIEAAIAQARMSRQFDPTQFSMRGQQGGSYKPPAAVQQRSNGVSAPSYGAMGQMSAGRNRSFM